MSDWFDAETHADRAHEMFERGRWAEAEQELRMALSLNPDHPEWQFNLGLTLEAAGRDADALACYQDAADLLPLEPEPLVAAGVVCSRLGRWEDAVRHLEEATRRDATNEAAYAHRIEAHHRLGDHDNAEVVFYMSQDALAEPSAPCLAAVAESLIERAQWDRAAWCLREALRLEPSMPRVRARLAAVLAATNETQRAAQLYLRELRDDPGNIDTLLDYGELLMDLGRLAEATEKFRRALELEPANVDAHYRLGDIALATGRVDQAFTEYELVYKLDPGCPNIRLALADALLRRRQLDRAQPLLLRELAVAGDPLKYYDPQARRRLGALLLEAGLGTEAASVLEQARVEQGESVELLRALSLARFQSGDREGGIIAARRVIRLDPTCVAAMHNLALAAIEDGRLRAAAGWIRRGLRVNRHDDGLRRLRVRLGLAAAKSLIQRRHKRSRA